MDCSRCARSADVRGPLCPQGRDTSVLLHRLAEAFILDGGLWCRGGSGAARATAVAAWACVRHAPELGAELGEGSVRQSHPSRHQDGAELGCGKLQGEHSAANTSTHSHMCRHVMLAPTVSPESCISLYEHRMQHTASEKTGRSYKTVRSSRPARGEGCSPTNAIRHPPDWCPGHRRP